MPPARVPPRPAVHEAARAAQAMPDTMANTSGLVTGNKRPFFKKKKGSGFFLLVFFFF